MAFGPIMKLAVGDLQVELAPLTKDAMGEYISRSHGGGLQRLAISQYLSRQTAPTLEDELEWYDRARAEKNTIIWGIWVVNGDERTLIGGTSIFRIGEIGHAPVFRQGETGCVIFNQEYWGKGIASAIHKARTWYAFQHLGLCRLQSAVLRPNVGSRKALERSGYTVTHTKRNEQYGNGEYLHLDWLECLNPLDLFWSTWWHGDRPTKSTRDARQRTLEAMEWAEKNVTL